MHNLFGSVHGGEVLPETVGGGNTTDSNIMTFLGMIEEKTNSLLQVFFAPASRRTNFDAVGSTCGVPSSLAILLLG